MHGRLWKPACTGQALLWRGVEGELHRNGDGFGVGSIASVCDGEGFGAGCITPIGDAAAGGGGRAVGIGVECMRNRGSDGAH